MGEVLTTDITDASIRAPPAHLLDRTVVRQRSLRAHPSRRSTARELYRHLIFESKAA